MQIQKPKPSTTKLIIIFVVIIALIGGGVVYANYIRNDNNPDDTTSETEGSNINLDPPTEQEIKDSQNAKERLLEGGDNEDEASNDEPDRVEKAKVTVGISYVGMTNNQLEIRAFSPSLISGSGTCTASVTKAGSQPITKTTPAFIDASSTICEPIYIPRSELTAGTWSVNVTYSSPTHEGSSGQTSVEVEVN